MKENHFDDKNKNYTMKPNFNDDETETFFKRQFHVNYFGITNEFFNELHQRYAIYAAEQHDEFSDLSPIEQVERYISDNDTQLALQVLTAHQHFWEDDMRNVLIGLKSRFAACKEKLRKKLATSNELTIEHNQINHAILELSKSLQHD